MTGGFKAAALAHCMHPRNSTLSHIAPERLPNIGLQGLVDEGFACCWMGCVSARSWTRDASPLVWSKHKIDLILLLQYGVHL